MIPKLLALFMLAGFIVAGIAVIVANHFRDAPGLNEPGGYGADVGGCGHLQFHDHRNSRRGQQDHD